jgi:hypothetical protein
MTYPPQDSESLGKHYFRHVAAMTEELFDVACQLAIRDKMIATLWSEYEDRKAQWGSEYLWSKHEDVDAISEVEAFITETQE